MPPQQLRLPDRSTTRPAHLKSPGSVQTVQPTSLSEGPPAPTAGRLRVGLGLGLGLSCQ